MSKDIGAGTLILMGSGAAPETVALLSGTIKSLPLSTSQGTVDITMLDVALPRWRSFLATLQTASGSTAFIDDLAGTFIRKVQAIRSGILHSAGASKVNMRIKYGGAVTGNLQADFTILITQADLNAELESAIGGNLSYTVDGPLAFSVQA